MNYEVRLVERDTPFELMLASDSMWLGSEFGDMSSADFAAWWRRSSQRAVLTGFEAREIQQRVMTDLVRECRSALGLPWIDLPENEGRVGDRILAHRMGYPDLRSVREMDTERVRRAVATYRWSGKRLRRQQIAEDQIAYVANTIYSRVLEPTLTEDDKAHYRALRNERTRRDVAPDELKTYTAEVLALLKSERWRDWAYNAVAEATNVPWQRARDTLDWLVARKEYVLALVAEGESNRPARRGERATRYRYCPEIHKLRRLPQSYVLGELVWRLALDRGPTSKREIRRSVRAVLGSASNPAIDDAIALLCIHGLLERSSNVNGSPSGYMAVLEGVQEKRTALLGSLQATVPPPCHLISSTVPIPCQEGD